MTAFVKMTCAVTAMFFPFLAGLLMPSAASDEVRLVVGSLGIGLGMAGVFGFSAIERREG